MSETAAESQAQVATEPAGDAVTAEAETPKSNVKRSLDDLLADLPEDTRKVLLGEVSKSRSEAKSLRERLKAAEPKISEYDRLIEASKTAEERALEARQAAEQRAAAAVQRVAKAELKAALAGIVDNPDAVVGTLDLSRFVDADGEVDAEAVDNLRRTFSSLTKPRAPKPDPSQASGANKPSEASPAEAFAAFLNRRP
jgi:DNA repair exonuclease SbcCD ATPase subunit